MADKKNLLLLFDRPQEPVFMTKGTGAGSVFDVPDTFLTDRYRPIGTEVQNRFSDTADIRIPVRNITIPDLSVPMELGRHENFSVFLPKHQRLAGRLVDIFVGLRNIEDLQSVAVYARDRLNPLLFNYALSVALLHRPDTKDLNLPLLFESFPEKFVDSKVINEMREEAAVVPEGSRMPILIPIDYTASDLEVEHRLWYFREDIGINLHHWHWHLVYPFEASDPTIVAKDRRGELFYYMHQQLVRRYNMERFSNGMPRVKRFNNLREPITEGYFPKMDSLVAARAWPPRFSDIALKDLNREIDQINLSISDLERWTGRIFDTIHTLSYTDANNAQQPLTEANGIDILGNIIESSTVSPNRQFYGDLHNMGHIFCSYIHDPDHRHLESFGVMGDTTTAMRDPFFYRWHAWIEDIFNEYKEMLPAYDNTMLDFPGVTVSDISVQPQTGGANTFQTFWQRSDVNLSRGLDFAPRGDVFARFTHLQHQPFTYTLNINNDSGAMRVGTARVFLLPIQDESGATMPLRSQRMFAVELDKFIVNLVPGANTVRRLSTESSLTIPFERTFRNLDTNRPAAGSVEESGFNFCGCGWPHHMLIPKGSPEGLACELFVVVTDFEQDRVDQDLVGTCNDAASFCGVRDRLYPDRKPMGFPFDRIPPASADSLANFRTGNMAIASVSVVHRNETTVRGQTKK